MSNDHPRPQLFRRLRYRNDQGTPGWIRIVADQGQPSQTQTADLPAQPGQNQYGTAESCDAPAGGQAQSITVVCGWNGSAPVEATKHGPWPCPIDPIDVEASMQGVVINAP